MYNADSCTRTRMREEISRKREKERELNIHG